ncbi:MAG: ATP-binding protein, partial [Acidobacteria bacterium]|nr:ATP-binding protein [Acidobacteriota bacterium]
MPRELTYPVQAKLIEDVAWYVDADGGLDVDRLLVAFQAFFREHSEHWLGRFDYAEAGPQLILQAFLQRVVNGGGRIEREYGLG